MSLRFTESGDPASPAVVLLHGLGVTSWMWDGVTPLLADRFHCVAVDLPGQGGSLAVPWESLADTAELVAELVERVGHDGRAEVVGLSQGGYVALALLARHPDLVRSAVVSGVSTRPLVRERWRGAVVRSAVVLLRSRLVARAGGALMGLRGEERAAYVDDVARLSRRTVERVYGEILDPVPPADEPVDAHLRAVVVQALDGEGIDDRELRRRRRPDAGPQPGARREPVRVHQGRDRLDEPRGGVGQQVRRARVGVVGDRPGDELDDDDAA